MYMRRPSKLKGRFESAQLDMITSLLPKFEKKAKKCWKKLLKAEVKHKRKKAQKIQRKLLRLNIIIGRFR